MTDLTTTAERKLAELEEKMKKVRELAKDNPIAAMDTIVEETEERIKKLATIPGMKEAMIKNGIATEEMLASIKTDLEDLKKTEANKTPMDKYNDKVMKHNKAKTFIAKKIGLPVDFDYNKEYELIQQKISKLSARQRKFIQIIVDRETLLEKELVELKKDEIQDYVPQTPKIDEKWEMVVNE